jgi:starvation-inducible outer membrane lipoprotein
VNRVRAPAWIALLTFALILAGCATLPAGIERAESHAARDTGSTRLAQTSRNNLAGTPMPAPSWRCRTASMLSSRASR